MKAILCATLAMMSIMLSGCNTSPQGHPKPPQQQPLIKPFVAIYQIAAEDPKASTTMTCTSDGKGRLRVDFGDKRKVEIYDCKAKSLVQARENSKTYTRMDLETMGPQHQFSLPFSVDVAGLQDECMNYDQIGSTQQMMSDKGLNGAGRKPFPKENIYLGDEVVDGKNCQHYLGDRLLELRREYWYSPELNCCVKTSQKVEGHDMGGVLSSSTSILKQYSDKVDPKVFDLDGYTYQPPGQFYAK